MIQITISSPQLSMEFDHDSGPLEFGRGPQRDVPRQVLPDPYVSRDQLVIEAVDDSRLRLQNLSEHVAVQIVNDRPLAMRSTRVVDLPVTLRVGQTELEFAALKIQDYDGTETLDASYEEFEPSPRLSDLGDSPSPEILAQWFETLVCVQQSAATSAEFYHETTRAVVSMVGLDRASVLLREGDQWNEAAHYTIEQSQLDELAAYTLGDDFIRTVPKPTSKERCGEIAFNLRVVNQVFESGQTYFEKTAIVPNTADPQNLEAVVAAPIFDNLSNVVGVVYGSRTCPSPPRECPTNQRGSGITQLEAQVIQVLAAAVGTGIERLRHQADAMRMQLQFEQFFSTKLARELAKDSALLEGRQREVTIVFSDVRDFSLISEHLGPRQTFQMMQDVMNLQTTIIHDFDGVVVDYVGDGLLAMWNAPTDQDDHAQRACRAVLEIMRQCPKLDEKWHPTINRTLQLGVGINTGAALVGNTGSNVKFKYGPMGPAVNIASRVQDATKQLGPSVLVTKSTHEKLDRSFATRRLCSAMLTGVLTPLDLYELSVEEPDEQWQKRRDAFEQALEYFQAGQWAETCRAINPLISDASGEYDIASLQLLSRAVECLKSNPDPFDPVVHIKIK